MEEKFRRQPQPQDNYVNSFHRGHALCLQPTLPPPHPRTMLARSCSVTGRLNLFSIGNTMPRKLNIVLGGVGGPGAIAAILFALRDRLAFPHWSSELFFHQRYRNEIGHPIGAHVVRRGAQVRYNRMICVSGSFVQLTVLRRTLECDTAKAQDASQLGRVCGACAHLHRRLSLHLCLRCLCAYGNTMSTSTSTFMSTSMSRV